MCGCVDGWMNGWMDRDYAVMWIFFYKDGYVSVKYNQRVQYALCTMEISKVRKICNVYISKLGLFTCIIMKTKTNKPKRKRTHKRPHTHTPLTLAPLTWFRINRFSV